MNILRIVRKKNQTNNSELFYEGHRTHRMQIVSEFIDSFRSH